MSTYIRPVLALLAATLLGSCGGVDPSGSDSDLLKSGSGTVACGSGTIGYWSNKNGTAEIDADDLAYLSGFRLVDGNGALLDLTTGTVAERIDRLSSFLRSASATSMANMLSAQWVAFALDNRNHGVCTDVGVAFYFPKFWERGAESGGLVTFSQLEAAVHAALAAGTTTTRAQMELLEDFFDAANNGKKVCACLPPTGATGGSGGYR